MSELRVRDHSQPCGHNEAEPLFDVDAWVCDRWDCPGGKEIVLTSMEGEYFGGFCKRGPARPDKLRWYWEFFVYEPYTHAVCGDDRVEVAE